MSIPDSVSAKIYKITEKTNSTVPNWIKEAAVKRVEEETGYRFCDNCKALKSAKQFSNGLCKACAARKKKKSGA